MSTFEDRIAALCPDRLALLRHELDVEDPAPLLVAYVETSGIAPDGQELTLHVQSRLPQSMVPSVFVIVEALPRSSNGKVDRLRLPDPSAATSTRQRDYLPPQTPTEETIVQYWAEALKVERVSRDDDFFELGGHSILATHMVARLRRALGVEIRLRALFDAPTPAGFAQYIDALLVTRDVARSDSRDREEFEV